jgi:hypothetical protein
MSRLVLAGSALAFLGVGALFLLDPAGMARHVGVGVLGATADNDVRAVYGGLQLGCGAFLLLCALRSEWHAAGLAAQLLLFGSLVAARVLSWLVVGLPETLGLALHAAEAGALVLGWLAWRRLPATHG